MKTCNRCLLEKPPTDFSRAKTCKDGYRNYCKQCQSLKKKEWYESNKEHVLLKTAIWAQNNREKSRKIKKKWALDNPEYGVEYKKQYLQLNRDKINAHTACRRKRVQRNTPSWVSMKEIRDFYLQCPKGFHVDHIVPLNGKLVSGLHVLGNLQYLPASENMSKGNRIAIHEEG